MTKKSLTTCLLVVCFAFVDLVG